MGRLSKHRDFARVSTVDDRGRISLPISFLGRVSWMKPFVDKRQHIDVYTILSDSSTLRLESPEVVRTNTALSALEKLAEEGSGDQIPEDDASMFLVLRLVKARIQYKAEYGGSREAYRLTIPVEQRQWLELGRSQNELCIVYKRNKVELWPVSRGKQALDRPLSALI